LAGEQVGSLVGRVVRGVVIEYLRIRWSEIFRHDCGCSFLIFDTSLSIYISESESVLICAGASPSRRQEQFDQIESEAASESSLENTDPMQIAADAQIFL